jgi:GNAT superfamily N-acetyltransferase
MHIRALDVPNDSSLIWLGISALYQEIFGSSAIPKREAQLQLEQQWRASEVGHWAYGAFDEDRLVGVCTLAESFAFFANGTYGIINELWVDPEYRSAGLGGQLLSFIIEQARVQGWQRLDVSSPTEERWIRSFDFYIKYGFSFTGKKLKYELPIAS